MSSTSFDGSQSLEALLDSYLGFGVPEAGEIREGTVVAVRNNDILVDIAAKSEGIIPNSEFDSLSIAQKQQLSVGNDVRVCVVEPEDSQGNIILSFLKVREQDDWDEARRAQQDQELVEVNVIGFNRGGVLVRMGALRGFCPASQLGFEHQVNRGESAEAVLKNLIGETLDVKILEADQDKGRLIFSELSADKEIRAKNRNKRLAELEEDGVYDGHVINLTDFGAFVDIGGIEGLVHSSELSWKHVAKPSKLLSLGQEVKVKIIGIDLKKQRVTFSMKQLESNPWEKLHDIYALGQWVDVTVTQITRYGAFARIEDEYRLEGLIHISEIGDEEVENPEEMIVKNQQLTARVIRLDAENKQIGFSLNEDADYLVVDDEG